MSEKTIHCFGVKWVLIKCFRNWSAVMLLGKIMRPSLWSAVCVFACLWKCRSYAGWPKNQFSPGSVSEPISCIRRLTSVRQRYSLWGQTPSFLGFRWRKRISVSDFLLHVWLTVYSPTQEWSWELRDHIYRWIFSQVASLHAVNS